MIPKKEIQDGKWYLGFCRNGYVAKWDAKRDKFIYINYSFQYFLDEIEHFEDVAELRTDGFVPMEIIERPHHKKIWDLKKEIGY